MAEYASERRAAPDNAAAADGKAWRSHFGVFFTLVLEHVSTLVEVSAISCLCELHCVVFNTSSLNVCWDRADDPSFIKIWCDLDTYPERLNTAGLHNGKCSWRNGGS